MRPQLPTTPAACFVAAILSIGGIGPSPASAALEVYEGFDYPDATSILGGEGGGGWSDAWNKSGNGAATEIATFPGLGYPTLPAIGGKVEISGQQTTGGGNSSFTFRSFNSSFGADGSTTWISFLGQRTGITSGADGPGDSPSYQRIFGISFFDGGNSTAEERFNIGELSSVADLDDQDLWSLNVFSTTPGANVVVPSATPIDQYSFLLARVDYGVGELADNAYLWVNPDLNAGEPSIGSAQASLTGRDLEFDRLRLSAGGSLGAGEIAAASGLIDEIRIGTDFSSVTGIGLIPGDVDGDGVADAADYNVIINHFHLAEASRSNGDLSGDGVVDLVDFRLWKESRSDAPATLASGGLTSTAPEPTAWVLVGIGASLATSRRPHR